MFYNSGRPPRGGAAMMDYSYQHQYNMYPDYYTPQYAQQYPPYPVPNFLNPMNSGNGSGMGGIGASGGTGSTAALTPTSLASLEQTFIELQSVPHANGGQAGNANVGMEPMTQSGFVPPVVDPSSREQSQDSFESDPEWEPDVKRGRGAGGMLVMDDVGQCDGTPHRKYTRRSRNEKLSPEEEERRKVRRERNKLAAAKCRQRRVDHTNALVEETEKLEVIKSELENEIHTLQQQRDQLELLLQAHVPLCKVHPHATNIKIKAEPSEGGAGTLMMGGCGMGQPRLLTSRPSSLSLDRGAAGDMPVVCPEGMPLSTPSSGLFSYTGLEGLVDGSPGLTTLSSGPGVSCSSQLHRSESESGSDNVSSPTLISL